MPRFLYPAKGYGDISLNFHLHNNPRPNNQPGVCTILIILCQRELEISLSVVVGDIGYDLGQSIVICREFTTLYPVTDQVAQDTAEILMSGVGQEASGVGQHSYKSGQITQVSQGDHLILHAGLVIIEPPCRTLLDLARELVLETADDGADGCIVMGFVEPFTKELPMEYAVELNRLISYEMEGSVG